MKEKWDQKFGGENYHYGKNPNSFYKSIIDKLPSGKILLLGEGEGRNAVYAAKKGWQVFAIDFSETGKEKALRLAGENNVPINYTIADVTEYIPPSNEFDAVALIFLHFGEDTRELVHQRVLNSLKPGGSLILEAFDKEQINNPHGGPRNVAYLYSLEDVYTDFHELQLEVFSKENINLDEGIGHSGKGEVIRLHGIKN